jgi:hypothetical protein
MDHSLATLAPSKVAFIPHDALRRLINQNSGSRLQARQQLICKPIVVRFASRQAEANRQAVGIDNCMNLAGQAPSRPAHGLFCVPRDTGTVLMHADNRRIDHLHGCVMRGS